MSACGLPLGRLHLWQRHHRCLVAPPDAIAATAPLRRRPKNLKLKLGDYLEYTPATGEPKNGAPGKPRATKVERAPRPKKPSKKQLEDAAEAARVAALAAAALERRNAPPVSKLEALALRVEERPPDRLRSRAAVQRSQTCRGGVSRDALSRARIWHPRISAAVATPAF